MLKRCLVIFLIIVFGIFAGIFRIYFWAFNEKLSTVAINNSSYSLKIGECRGSIYDCNKVPLVNETQENYCCVFPSIDACNSLSKILNSQEILDYAKNLNSGKPFCIKLKSFLDAKDFAGLRTFKVPIRYNKQEDQIIPHVLGYLNSTGDGVCGIEKSFNSVLKNFLGKLSVNYKKDALGRVFSLGDISVKDNLYLSRGGVVLTIDKSIQRVVHDVAKKGLKKGAIIVFQVPNCKIRAMVSFPEFDPINIGSSIKNNDSPFLNRALHSYNAGSVFKIVTAMAILEESEKINEQEILDFSNNIYSKAHKNYNCEASTVVGNSCFHCANCKSHGDENLKDALSNSCNTYFIDFSKDLNKENFHRLIENLGFGKSIKLANDIVAENGNIPSLEEMKDANELANLSFGQGKLMVTPLQIAGLINTIASGGIKTEPSLVEGIVGPDFSFIEKKSSKESERIVSIKTANEIKQGMLMCAKAGTGTLGKPENIDVCVKTSTAQTGIKIDGKDILMGWFAGFYPSENPKYGVVILKEDVSSGGVDCGPIFKEIVEKISLLQ